MQITSIIPKYTQVNSITTNVINQRSIYFNEQQLVTDFYSEFNDTFAFETMLTKLIVETDKETFQTLVQSLYKEVQENIKLISSNKFILQNINTERACDDFVNQHDFSIKIQREITQKISKKLNVINGSLDAIGYRENSEEEENRLLSEQKKLDEQYKTERRVLNELYKEQDNARKMVANYLRNCFRDILSLSKKLSIIIEKYLPKTSVNLSEGVFFDMAKSSAIYEICNGDVFEDVSETNFYSAINLQVSDILRLKKGEKTRACYFIYRLSESLDAEKKAYWRNIILHNLGIKETYYKSKYKECALEVPSRKSEEFVNKIDEIFD
ncbi:hypothetical protein CAPN010_19770 [Capnocytophaga cynodegmi]|uniref:hypothetical protein n=1 Tax=Capnocytophaga cynodegmi TaxID=28189 RepID=UPI001EE1C99A|nr:hypothetical protein [Capnocytophaga cynodegmi]GJQ07819.1 hypothetical protein CAPN010_19770 [Capnocytophaga cynodegmi]